MADKNISELQTAAEVALTDYTHLRQGGIDRKATMEQVKDKVLEDLANDSDPTKGATLVGYDGGTVAQALEENKDDITRNDRSVNFGVFKTPAALGHRAGRVAYSITHSGAKLVSDLSRYFAAGWNLSPETAVARGLSIAWLSESGNDANSGATLALAKRRFSAAFATGADVIYIDAGHFDISDGWTSPTLTKDLVLKSVGGTTLFSSRRKTTWADNGNGTWTSGTLGGTPITMYDSRVIDEYGLVKLAKLSDVPSVVATPNSWCISGGSGSTQVVTVNLGGLTPSDTDTIVNRSTNRNLDFGGGNHKFYAEKIQWSFGDNSGLTPRNGGESSVFAAVDCEFSYGEVNDGLRVQGVGLSICVGCTAKTNGKDGFNYHQAPYLTMVHAVEVDCAAYNNLTAGTGNGSTIHESCRAIRIGCSYGRNRGPGVADIQTSKSYNVACNSSSNYFDPNSKGFLAADSAEMWLHHCDGGGNFTADLATQNSATARISGCKFGSSASSGLSSVVEFDPRAGWS